jgi:hypothetical protein
MDELERALDERDRLELERALDERDRLFRASRRIQKSA